MIFEPTLVVIKHVSVDRRGEKQGMTEEGKFQLQLCIFLGLEDNWRGDS